MKTVIVCAAVILKGSDVLLAQRKEGTSQAMKWEFPGGKLEEGENPESCIIREIKEELNITVAVKDIFKVVAHCYSDKRILLLSYLCRHADGIPVAYGCKDFAWVPVTKLLNYDLAEADLPIAKKLQALKNGM